MDSEVISVELLNKKNAIQELSFGQALVMSDFYSKIIDSSLENIRQETISSLGVRQFVESLQLSASIKQLKDSPDIIFELSNQGKKLLVDGKATFLYTRKKGEILPQIVGADDKKFIESFKGKKVDLGTKAAKLPMIIIAAAHMISAADLAKRLCTIDLKLEKVLSLRKSDLISRLESNYNLAREVTSSNELSSLDILTLRDLHKENMFLRSAWRREVEFNISEISTPDKSSLFDKTTTLQSTIDKKLCKEIKFLEDDIYLIEFSMIYDIVLTDLSGHGEVFRAKNSCRGN